MKKEKVAYRELTNMNDADAEKSGWKMLKPLPNCEVVGKAIWGSGLNAIMKSTKRFKVCGGWIYNTTTEYRRKDNISVAEALVFVPEVELGSGVRLETMSDEQERVK